jgi:hypothetical protein
LLRRSSALLFRAPTTTTYEVSFSTPQAPAQSNMSSNSALSDGGSATTSSHRVQLLTVQKISQTHHERLIGMAARSGCSTSTVSPMVSTAWRKAEKK